MKYVPVGKDDFKKVIDGKYYYVDKSKLIKDIIGKEVILYTRPRRFGKSLNMSMLNYYYNIKEKENAYLFEGLKIAEDEEAKQHQNKYPVIYLTLKDMKRDTFAEQVIKFQSLISDIIGNYLELLESSKLDEADKQIMKAYRTRTSNVSDLQDVLLQLSNCLEKHYGEKVMILIDEYDVPLQYAYTQGYYEEMVNFIRNVFSAGLKTNTSLYQGVLTGCLRIAKESIFTGMNNFKVNSIFEYEKYPSYGFTEEEVYEMLESYGLAEHMEVVKAWYDGYLFGDNEIYNPWSTMMYVDAQLTKETKQAKSYWANTSGNEIIIEYIKRGKEEMKKDFHTLIHHGSISKMIYPEITYRDIENIENIYSFLLFSGYLKLKTVVDESADIYELVIPNEEVRKVYVKQFERYFTQFRKDRSSKLLKALQLKEVDEVKKILNEILKLSISYYDNKESFYHGFLVGILQGIEEVRVVSNREGGDGRFDIVIYPDDIESVAIIIECKHSKERRMMRKDSLEGAQQILNKKYEEQVRLEGYEQYIGYGISFHKKQCYITVSDGAI